MDKEVIDYRRKRAGATLQLAEHCCTSFDCNDALNRAYFACYYAVSALLGAHDLSANGHDETVQIFTRDFIETGLISESSGRDFAHLAKRRLEVDYEDFKDASADEVQQSLATARGLIGEIDGLMHGKLADDLL